MSPHDPADEPAILLDVEDRVATITLNRPAKMNALDIDAWGALTEAIETVRNDGARVLVIRGSGDNFCAGADITATGQRVLHPLDRMEIISGTVRRLFELPIPAIAAVDGVAVGAGWNIALACDFVIATDRARFSQIFARRGLSVDCGGSWLLPRLVSMQTARRLLYLAEMLSAEEVDALGLLLQRVAPDALAPTVADLAGRLRAGPPVAIRQDKTLLNEAFGRTFAEQLAQENAAQLINFATDAPVAREAITAKRTPVFEGTWRA